MKATTMYINYEPGEFYITQGHKGYEKRHQNKAGRYVNPTGERKVNHLEFLLA